MTSSYRKLVGFSETVFVASRASNGDNLAYVPERPIEDNEGSAVENVLNRFMLTKVRY